MSFTTEIVVRFAHVDGAGIVFYPRYLEMVNETVERWFEEKLGMTFRDMHLVHHCGVPTRRIDVDFLKPSRLGDRLQFTLRVLKIGRSSFDLDITCASGGETRFTASSTLVFSSFEPLTAVPIPDELRTRMQAYADAQPLKAANL